MRATTKTGLGLGLLGALAVACGSPDSGSTSTNASSFSASSATDGGVPAGEFVFVQAASSGYAVTPLNGATRSATVTTLDLSGVGVDLESIQSALATPQSVAAVGTVQGDAFVATALYETLPGVAASAGDSFYLVQAQQGGGAASELNATQSRDFSALDLHAIQVPYLDTVWLTSRIMDGSAVVAGSFDGDGNAAPFDVSAVYLPLPDTTKCPELVPVCTTGVVTYSRDANRCLIGSGCTSPKACPEFVPVCPAGYTLAGWTGDDGCSTFRCDPTFDPAPKN